MFMIVIINEPKMDEILTLLKADYFQIKIF